MRRRSCAITAIVVLLSLMPGVLSAQTQAAARAFYLDPLIYPHRYTAAKNSFIFQNLKRGERKTLAELKGSGSLRHVWTTWARSFDLNAIAEAGQVIIRIFVDGEKAPSVAGTIDEIFRAAAATRDRYVPEPAFNYEGAFNIYLPVFFRRGLHVEIEALSNLDEFYAQLDYRLTALPESAARLVSRRISSGVTIKYLGQSAPDFGSSWRPVKKEVPWHYRETTLPAGGEHDVLELRGSAIIHGLSIKGDNLDDLQLIIFWDDEPVASVNAPLKYFFGGFDTLALQAEPGKFTCYFPMPFRKNARIKIRNQEAGSKTVTVGYSVEPNAKLIDVRYFHALFNQAQTNGYRDFNALAVSGEGHFVGISLYDSGHNHGGGDTALIDAEYPSPQVLHGIAGEDYFSFAWHKTGRMHLFAGAPQHERRYRFHLENPYPFHTSLLFNFGVFAGLEPKAVTYWYQKPNSRPANKWTAPDMPWKVFGPIDEGMSIPEKIDKETYDRKVTLAKPEQFAASWKDAQMVSGFLDLTHHYRHFLTKTKGTGFVAGNCKEKAVTYVYTSRARLVEVIIGHDDLVEVFLNDRRGIKLPARIGFRPAPVKLALSHGWNKLTVLIHNRENVNWRWAGISLAWSGNKACLRDLRFSTAPLTSGFRKSGRANLWFRTLSK